jgi:hypothetical protein
VKLKDPIYCDESMELLLGQLIVCIRPPALDQENELKIQARRTQNTGLRSPDKEHNEPHRLGSMV